MSGTLHETGKPMSGQKPCCYGTAMETDATFCGQCGKPIIRCMAFEECGGLLDVAEQCPVCVDPHLQIDAGALTSAQVGGAVALPISIANASVVGRPLFVTALWSREAGGDWREEVLGWERLQAGQAGPVTITADKLARAGVHAIDVRVAVASRWRARQEAFAFTAGFKLTVRDDAKQAAPIVNFSGGDGTTQANSVLIKGFGRDTDGADDRAHEAFDLTMVRAEKDERALGLRGLDETRWVPRDTRFEWIGFREHDVVRDGPILTPDGVLVFGRSRTRAKGGHGDVRLLVEEANGDVDRDLSVLISRRHFELYVENNRLVLRVAGSGGVRVNDKAYGTDKTVRLAHGDTIWPLIKYPEKYTIKIEYRFEHGQVATVRLIRFPKSLKEG